MDLDRFHISQHINKAVDKVRQQENKKIIQQGDDRLAGTKSSWLSNKENLSEEVSDRFNGLNNANLKAYRAWAIKELSRDFWPYTYADLANVILINGAQGQCEVARGRSRKGLDEKTTYRIN